MSGTVITRPLTEREILAWADAYRELTGQWPTRYSGPIAGTIGETWGGVDRVLREGRRGLSSGSSLAKFLVERRGARSVRYVPPLGVEQILRWADEYHQKEGAWPTTAAGPIPGTGGESWAGVDAALQAGGRELPGGSSLARLLAEHRGVPNRRDLPPFTESQILAWADAYHARTGSWPRRTSGPIPEAPRESWSAVEVALTHGRRGLPGGSSLAFLLADQRGVRNAWTRPNLAVEAVLAWADAHHARTGQWPRVASGPIREAPGETWRGVDRALRGGTRGLPGDSSLAQLLQGQRGARNHLRAPRLGVALILRWADEHARRTGAWPTVASGPIPGAPGESWRNVDHALRLGSRGLRGGGSLAQLLEERRGLPNPQARPPLSRKKILRWADAQYQRTGRWPDRGSGPVVDAPGETWKMIDHALRAGQRGLPGGSGLTRLLAGKRGARHPLALPPLTEQQILEWADRHFQETGAWPRYTSGPVTGTPGETWMSINRALCEGRRGLPGHLSLAQLLAERRELPYWSRRPKGEKPPQVEIPGGLAPDCPSNDSAGAVDCSRMWPPSPGEKFASASDQAEVSW